jgi:hypothetical protein
MELAARALDAGGGDGDDDGGDEDGDDDGGDEDDDGGGGGDGGAVHAAVRGREEGGWGEWGALGEEWPAARERAARKRAASEARQRASWSEFVSTVVQENLMIAENLTIARDQAKAAAAAAAAPPLPGGGGGAEYNKDSGDDSGEEGGGGVDDYTSDYGYDDLRGPLRLAPPVGAPSFLLCSSQLELAGRAHDEGDDERIIDEGDAAQAGDAGGGGADDVAEGGQGREEGEGGARQGDEDDEDEDEDDAPVARIVVDGQGVYMPTPIYRRVLRYRAMSPERQRAVYATDGRDLGATAAFVDGAYHETWYDERGEPSVMVRSAAGWGVHLASLAEARREMRHRRLLSRRHYTSPSY